MAAGAIQVARDSDGRADHPVPRGIALPRSEQGLKVSQIAMRIDAALLVWRHIARQPVVIRGHGDPRQHIVIHGGILTKGRSDHGQIIGTSGLHREGTRLAELEDRYRQQQRRRDEHHRDIHFAHIPGARRGAGVGKYGRSGVWRAPWERTGPSGSARALHQIFGWLHRRQ